MDKLREFAAAVGDVSDVFATDRAYLKALVFIDGSSSVAADSDITDAMRTLEAKWDEMLEKVSGSPAVRQGILMTRADLRTRALQKAAKADAALIHDEAARMFEQHGLPCIDPSFMSNVMLQGKWMQKIKNTKCYDVETTCKCDRPRRA